MEIRTPKEKAVEFMIRLDICKAYLDCFKDDGDVHVFENFCGYKVDYEPEVKAKIKEIEKKYDVIVYAVTHEYTNYYEFYNFLYVTNDEEEWDLLFSGYGERHRVMAYVWNKTSEWRSELGSVMIQSFGGGIARVFQGG